MKDLIEALQIFLKYANPDNPTQCDHDILYVDVPKKGMSQEDFDRLGEIGFSWDDQIDCFSSFKYGSC